MSRRTRIRLSCVFTDAIERNSLIIPFHMSLKLLGFPNILPFSVLKSYGHIVYRNICLEKFR